MEEEKINEQRKEDAIVNPLVIGWGLCKLLILLGFFGLRKLLILKEFFPLPFC